MNFTSTRGGAAPEQFSSAIAAGLAPDGGLYVPASLPTISFDAFEGAARLPDIAAHLLRPFFADDVLAGELDVICAEVFNFPVPLRAFATQNNFMLELFHGPTAAFKDLGARFLAACIARQSRNPARPLTLLVATSGDTGAAAAAAFHRRPDLRVVLLYPDGGVSQRQAHHSARSATTSSRCASPIRSTTANASSSRRSATRNCRHAYR